MNQMYNSITTEIGCFVKEIPYRILGGFSS